MEQTQEYFARELREAIRRGDEEAFRGMTTFFPPDWGDDPSLYEGFPAPVFETVLSVLSDGSVSLLGNSSQLFLLLELEWNNLSAAQKDGLLPALGKCYGEFQDPLADFVISELLGEYYCDEKAFLVLVGLRERIKGRARALIPHGFEHIAKSGPGELLRRQALSELNGLRSDADEEVRKEADISLERLSSRVKE
jgi:hypothetical protein